MLKVGITGGIGTGKSTVSQMFAAKGIAVYDSDLRAKTIMLDNEQLVGELKNEFGEKVYVNGQLNRTFLAKIVFDSKNKLAKLNSIVHPFVANDFSSWLLNQNSKFILKEAAILFESGAYLAVDKVVLVTCPLSIRIDRVSKRDGISEKDIMKRVNNQMQEKEKAGLSDFVIDNKYSLESLQKQVDDVYLKLMELV